MTDTERAIINAVIAESAEEKSAAKNVLLKMMNEDNAANAPRKTKPLVDAESTIQKILTELGVPCHIKGHGYLVTAIDAAVKDAGIITAITKELYPMVAVKHNTVGSRVERAIRHAIEIAWDRCDLSVLYKFFGNTVSSIKGKPTNSDHVAWSGLFMAIFSASTGLNPDATNEDIYAVLNALGYEVV